MELGSELKLIGDALTGGVKGGGSDCCNDKVGDDAREQRRCGSL